MILISEMTCEGCGIDFTYPADQVNRKFCTHQCSLLNRPRMPEIERFWNRVQKGGPNECWPWIAGCIPSGYGSFPADDGKNWAAHRFAWTLKNGPIPPGKFVLHSCDNPPCVNDNHHFLGTKKDNTHDMIAKGRGGWKKGDEWQSGHAGKSAKGERNRHAKLTASDIPIIRQKAADGKKLTEIADEYGLWATTIGMIVSRKNWKHIP